MATATGLGANGHMVTIMPASFKFEVDSKDFGVDRHNGRDYFRMKVTFKDSKNAVRSQEDLWVCAKSATIAFEMIGALAFKLSKMEKGDYDNFWKGMEVGVNKPVLGFSITANPKISHKFTGEKDGNKVKIARSSNTRDDFDQYCELTLDSGYLKEIEEYAEHWMKQMEEHRIAEKAAHAELHLTQVPPTGTIADPPLSDASATVPDASAAV